MTNVWTEGHRISLISFERVVLNKIIVREGEGVASSPVRWVTYWLDDAGETLWRSDPWQEDSTEKSGA